MKVEVLYEQKEFKLNVLISDLVMDRLREKDSELLRTWQTESGCSIELFDRRHSTADMFFTTFKGTPRSLWIAQKRYYELLVVRHRGLAPARSC